MGMENNKLAWPKNLKFKKEGFLIISLYVFSYIGQRKVLIFKCFVRIGNDGNDWEKPW